MTAIKQVSVTKAAHAKNLGAYLNDERALVRDSQHIIDPNRWEQEMERTRAAYGHDKPSRAGAANTIMLHQVLAFNPDECDVNGGKVTPELAMEYARDYVQTRYGNQEAVWVLHREHCRADGTDRYAVHIGINRTDLETGKRLNEGRSRNAKIERANAVRDMDRRYGLAQLRAGQRNSLVHARQPTRAEKRLERVGIRTDKQYIRDAIKASIIEVRRYGEGEVSLQDLADSLRAKGVSMTMSKNGRDFTFEREKNAFKISGYKLGRGYSMEGISYGLDVDQGQEMSRDMDAGMEM